MSKYWHVKSPISVHVEVTQACDERCRHCYNFFRGEEEDIKPRKISWDDLNHTIDELIKNEVMHVIITGGEPLLALDRTRYLAEKAMTVGMTVSLNSNLVSATRENMKSLKGSGIDHILTTLHSSREEVHDYIASAPGAFKKILTGIKLAQENGIRITVNTILSQFNKDDIYQIGKLVHSLGVKKYLANRTIPSPTNDESLKAEFRIGKAEINRMFEDLLRLKHELGMDVGTCRTVPQCFFDTFDGYDDFLARGCAAGKKHLLLNVDGESHACVHESKSYGNIHEVGLKKIWANMSEWRSLKYIPDECQSCHLFDFCDGGCRLIAQEHTSSIKGYDNLCRGANHLPQYDFGVRIEHKDAASKGVFKVHPDFDYRKEKGFYVVRIIGARVDFIEEDLCRVLIERHRTKRSLRLIDIGTENLERLAYFIKRGLVVLSK